MDEDVNKGNAKNDLEIDRNNLELEWEKQAGLYFFYAEQSADAIEAQTRAKDAVDLVEAQLDKEIRDDPGAFDLDKLTETRIKSTIYLQGSYKDAKNTAIECTKTVKVLQAILQAFEHKKSALENLGRLFLSNYYAEPTVSDNAKEKIIEDGDMGSESRAFKG